MLAQAQPELADVLANLTATEQALFRVADRAGRKAAQDVQTLAANWRHFLAWQDWTRKEKDAGRLVQGWPDQALERRKDLLTIDGERPAS